MLLLLLDRKSQDSSTAHNIWEGFLGDLPTDATPPPPAIEPELTDFITISLYYILTIRIKEVLRYLAMES